MRQNADEITIGLVYTTLYHLLNVAKRYVDIAMWQML